MKVALVHDYLNQYGGAERVLEVFSEAFPEAPIYTLFYDEKLTSGVFKGKDIRTSFLQKIPFSRKYHQVFPVFMPVAAESLDFRDYDVVLSDSASFAKGVITKPSTLHICYLHTPLRYAWDKSHEYLSEFPMPRVIKWVAPFVLAYLRMWDKDASSRPDILLTNSQFVRSRIRKYYGRDAEVVYPSIDPTFFGEEDISANGEYFLMVGRLTPYKRFGLTVEVFNELGWPLKIIGNGPERRRLERRAKKNVEFFGTVSDGTLRKYYAGAKALIFPQEEDFGIVPLEAMAAGRPVIAFRAGGALESVKEGETGMFFDEQTPESLQRVLHEFNSVRFDSEKIREHARKFSKDLFKSRIKEIVEKEYERFGKSASHLGR